MKIVLYYKIKALKMCAELQQQQQTETQLLLQLWYARQQQRDPLLLTTLQHFSPSPASSRGIPFCQPLSLCTTLLWKRDSLLLFTFASTGIPTYSVLCLCRRALQLPREGFPNASHIPLQHSTLVCSREIPFYFCSTALRLSQQRDSTINLCHTSLRVERFPSIFFTFAAKQIGYQQRDSATSKAVALLLRSGFLSASHIPLQHIAPGLQQRKSLFTSYSTSQQSAPASSERIPFYYSTDTVQFIPFGYLTTSAVLHIGFQLSTSRGISFAYLCTAAAHHPGYHLPALCRGIILEILPPKHSIRILSVTSLL